MTGGSRGIGLSIAREFAKEGAAVSICARGQESLDKARSLLEKSGGEVHAATCDVSDPQSLQEYIEDAVAALSGLNILVNNPSGFGRTDDEEGWQAGLDVDLMALVRGSWAAIPHIEKAGGGALIHTSSISGLTSSLRTPPYGAVKAAVIQYTKTPCFKNVTIKLFVEEYTGLHKVLISLLIFLIDNKQIVLFFLNRTLDFVRSSIKFI